MSIIQETNEQLIRDFFDNDLLRAYRYAHLNRGEILLSKKQILPVAIKFLHNMGFNSNQISNMIVANRNFIKKYCNNSKIYVGKRTINAILALECDKNPLILLDKVYNYSFLTINVKKYFIENIIAGELFRAGFTNNQIAKALNMHIRRVQRISKQTRERGTQWH